METFRGERCGIDNCRSREYHINDGLTYCRRGHLKEGRIEHEQDYDDLNVAASQTTRIKDSQKEEQTRRELQELGGPRGFKLYRHVYEHILRCQLQVLVQKGYPTEIEAIVRELWALRVQIVAENGVDLNKDGSTGLNNEPPGGPLSEDDGSEDDLRHPRRDRVPALAEMFAFCYMALVILRIPISVSKMHDWISKEELHFLGVMKVVPVEMKRKFEPWFFSVFMARSPMRRDTLHKHISELYIKLSERYETFRLPSLNWKPLLFDHIVQLGLPMHVFAFIHGAARILSLEFSFPSGRTQGRQSHLARLPDVQLMAWVIFAVKYYYPFDSKERFATGPRDPGYLTLNWDTWEKLHVECEQEFAENGPRIKPGTEVDVALEQVADFDDEQADAYMNWFADTWLEDNTAAFGDRYVKVPEGLKKMFPIDVDSNDNGDASKKEGSLSELQKLEAGLNDDLIRRVHASLKPRRIISEEKAAHAKRQIPRPGSIYYKYKSVEDLDKHEHALQVHKRAADVASVKITTLMQAIKEVERKVKAWQDSDPVGEVEAAATKEDLRDQTHIQRLQDIRIDD